MTNRVRTSDAIACNALRGCELYDWITEQPSPVYVHWKNGHIAVAIPGKWFGRYSSTPSVTKMAQRFIEKYSMEYYADEEVHKIRMTIQLWKI
ncbi:hypothetical protein [Duncaniella dubosii]|uniref:hypothetical protein n=1 Tax=Duncaniella dubosii TaxID=2518971 RepID=UPI003F67D6CD